MLENDLFIKDFCNKYEDDFTPIYGLDVWFHSLLNKRIGDLNVNDICKMIRQDILLEEIALDKAIEFLRRDPLAGNMFDGEILEMINRVPFEKYFCKKESIKDLKNILVQIKENLAGYDWISKDDMKRYSSTVNNMLRKLEKV